MMLNDTKLAIITPLAILIILISFTQLFIIPNWITDHKFPVGGSNTADLLLLGYNYNKDPATMSVTLWNKGTRATNITGISYDQGVLIMGTVGSPTDLLSANGTVSANDIVFPAADHWNMYTGGPGLPVIEPNGMATFYLGIGPTIHGSIHTLIVTSAIQNYAFNVQG
jgi:hypothetical protein